MRLRFTKIRDVVQHQDAVKDAPPVWYGGTARENNGGLIAEPVNSLICRGFPIQSQMDHVSELSIESQRYKMRI